MGCRSVIQLCPTLCNPVDCSMPGLPVLHYLPKLAQTHVHWIGGAFLLLPLVIPSIRSFPTNWLFTWEGQGIGTSASASVLPVNIQDWFPFKIHWFDLLAVQETLKSLTQHHSWKHQILRHAAFFMVQLSHPYITTRKTIALVFLYGPLSAKQCLCFLIHCLGLS